MPGGGKSFLAPQKLNNHAAGRFLKKLLSGQPLLGPPPSLPATADKLAHPEKHEKNLSHVSSLRSHVTNLRFRILGRATCDVRPETIFSKKCSEAESERDLFVANPVSFKELSVF